MSVQIRPIRDTFAREVIGQQLWQEISPADMDKIHSAWADSGVLVFRRQVLSEKELVALCNRFGRVFESIRSEWASPGCPEVILISNLKNDENKYIGLSGTKDVWWHTDQSYLANPATGSILYGVEIPFDGSGNTWWTNLRLAYDALPATLRTEAEGKRAIYDYNSRLESYEESARKVTEEQQRLTPPVTHALVQTHPTTGKKTLYMDPSTIVGVEGMSTEAGKDLIRRLVEVSTQPEFTYEHMWEVGDVVMWDNAFTMHRRAAYDSKYRRLHKRMTIRLPADKYIVPIGKTPVTVSHQSSEAHA